MEDVRRELIDENLRLLGQVQMIILRLPASLYRQQHAQLGSGSIGQQVRHVLNHYETLLQADGDVDYESRTRDVRVESSPDAGLDCLEGIVRGLLDLRTTYRQPGGCLQVLESLEGVEDLSRVPLATSLERELSFLASHTTHHLAIVRILAAAQGVALSDEVGVAKATRLYHEATEASQSFAKG